MNGYQRIKSALAGEWPDRRPIMLHNFMVAAKESGFTMRQYCTNPDVAAKSHIYAVEKYDLDGVLWDIDTAVLASAVGVPVDFPLYEPARTVDYNLRVLEQVKELEEPNVSRNERVQMAVEGFKIIRKYFNDEIFLRANTDQAPFSLASMMRSPTNWMMDLITDPELCHKLLEYCTKACKQFIKLMVDEGAHMISNGDSPAGPAMISPDMYHEFALPYEKVLVDYSHQFSLPYLLHICGDTELILTAMPKTGLDAVELDYKTDMKKIYQLYGENICFFGNIDPSGVITNGTPELIRKKVKELLDVYKSSPRFVMNSGCAIPYSASEENIWELVKVTKSYKI
jgi:MtaA/CmuA family methyltransferase